jgi:ABC-2 type transport system permease protein
VLRDALGLRGAVGLHDARGLLGIARMGWRTPWVYRFDALVGLASIAVRVALFILVWRALYVGHDTVSGVNEETAVGYAVLALTVATALMPWPGAGIARRVRRGLIGVDLLRPPGLVAQTMAGQVGTGAAMLPRAAVGLAVGLAMGGLVPPAGFGAGVGFVVSLLLALVLGHLLTFVVSMTSFWTLEVGGLMMIYGMVSTFLAGGLVPLWLMPDWLRTLAEWLPFQASTFTPLAIYMGRPPGGLVAALGVQVLWIAVLAGVSALVWRRAKYRVVVQGG